MVYFLCVVFKISICLEVWFDSASLWGVGLCQAEWGLGGGTSRSGTSSLALDQRFSFLVSGLSPSTRPYEIVPFSRASLDGSVLDQEDEKRLCSSGHRLSFLWLCISPPSAQLLIIAVSLADLVLYKHTQQMSRMVYRLFFFFLSHEPRVLYILSHR